MKIVKTANSIVIFSVILLLFISSIALAQGVQVYENKDYKFRFTHPQGWEPMILKKSKVDGIIVTFTSPDTFASVSVEATRSTRKTVEELSEEEIRQVVEESVDEARSFLPNIKVNINSFSVENFKDWKAIKITTTCPAQYFLPESTDTVYVFFRDSFKYEISFGGFVPGMDQYRDILIESVNSFEFVP